MKAEDTSTAGGEPGTCTIAPLYDYRIRVTVSGASQGRGVLGTWPPVVRVVVDTALDSEQHRLRGAGR